MKADVEDAFALTSRTLGFAQSAFARQGGIGKMGYPGAKLGSCVKPTGESGFTGSLVV